VKEANLKLLRDLEPDEKRLSIYRGDIADADFITEVFEKEKPTWVCHLAARAGVRYSIIDPYIYVHSNVKGTVQLMDLSVKHNITNFVYASSSSVYGGSKSTFFSEMENVDHPISPYAASKKSVELMAYTYHHLYGLKTSGLRFFTVYGPVSLSVVTTFRRYVLRSYSSSALQNVGCLSATCMANECFRSENVLMRWNILQQVHFSENSL
jgi:UDP-glucuronate 4-epimerase